MKIAFFSEYYSPHIGGVEFRVRGLAHALAAKGHDVVVHTTGYDRALPRYELDGAVKVERCDNAGYDAPFLGLRRNPLAILIFALWCRRKASLNFDLCIYGEFPFLHAVLAPAKARRHGIMDWCEYRSGRLFGYLQAWLPRRFRWNMATSDGVARRIREASGQPVFTTPSGITASEFHSNPVRDGVLYLGRLFRHKNLPLTIAAFEHLCDRGYRGVLTIAGGGTEEHSVRACAAASRGSARIVLLGEVDSRQKRESLAGAEVMLLLSSREGFPVTIAEAMASGLPTVTVDLPDNGGAQIVEQYDAGLVAAADASAIADAVEKILSDRQSWTERCLRNAAGLEWTVLADALLKQVQL